MAKASGRYQRRLNVYSNPRQGTGTTDMEDNARALRLIDLESVKTDLFICRRVGSWLHLPTMKTYPV